MLMQQKFEPKAELLCGYETLAGKAGRSTGELKNCEELAI